MSQRIYEEVLILRCRKKQGEHESHAVARLCVTVCKERSLRIGWSEGYAALGCSRKDKNIVINYIKNQREHHTNISLREEYIRFLKEAGLELDKRDWDR